MIVHIETDSGAPVIDAAVTMAYGSSLAISGLTPSGYDVTATVATDGAGNASFSDPPADKELFVAVAAPSYYSSFGVKVAADEIDLGEVLTLTLERVYSPWDPLRNTVVVSGV